MFETPPTPIDARACAVAAAAEAVARLVELAGEERASARAAALSLATTGPLREPQQVLDQTRALLTAYKQLASLIGDELLEIRRRDLAQHDGWPTTLRWAEVEGQIARGEAGMLLRAATVKPELPRLAELHEQGRLCAGFLTTADAATGGFGDEAKAQADEFLAEEGRIMTLREFGVVARELRETVVPELVEAELEQLRESSHLTASPEAGGGLRVSGVVYGASAEAVRAGIDRFSKPLVDDHRDAAQRRAEGLALALGVAARAALTDRDLDGTGYTPEDLPPVRVQVIADLPALSRAWQRATEEEQRRGVTPTMGGSDRFLGRDRFAPDLAADGASPGGSPGESPGASVTFLGAGGAGRFPRSRAELSRGAVGERTRCPVDWRTLVQMCCHAELQRLVLGPRSEILDLGRRVRLFTAAQRAALKRGHGRCMWRGCDSPWVEADHVQEFAAGGRTDIADGRMLCAFHHMLRHRGWTLELNDDGTWTPTPPPDWAHQLNEIRRQRRRHARPRAS